MWISPYKYVLSLGHLCSDINQSILSAVLPFLIATYHYDYTTAAMLVTVSNVFGAFVQPFIGMLSDKKNKLLSATKNIKGKKIRIYSLFTTGIKWFKRSYYSCRNKYYLKTCFTIYQG